MRSIAGLRAMAHPANLQDISQREFSVAQSVSCHHLHASGREHSPFIAIWHACSTNQSYTGGFILAPCICTLVAASH
jgi:hypothetical protein